MQVQQYAVGPVDNNTYLVFDSQALEAVVVDPSFDSEAVIDDARSRGLRITAILDTHAHFDHVALNAYFVEQTGASILLHQDDLPLYRSMRQQAQWFGLPAPAVCEPGRLLADGDVVAVGAEELVVLHAPGHSPGGVCFLGDGFVIVGDALFAGSIGRTDLPGGDMDKLLQSIQTRLLTLPDETVVYPGHGPATTIGAERRTNPFVGGLS
jgi:glyoxylase-like metal-dependent hydrolase (beta-lactamase superfamily II)